MANKRPREKENWQFGPLFVGILGLFEGNFGLFLIFFNTITNISTTIKLHIQEGWCRTAPERRKHPLNIENWIWKACEKKEWETLPHEMAATQESSGAGILKQLMSNCFFFFVPLFLVFFLFFLFLVKRALDSVGYLNVANNGGLHSVT